MSEEESAAVVGSSAEAQRTAAGAPMVTEVNAASARQAAAEAARLAAAEMSRGNGMGGAGDGDEDEDEDEDEAKQAELDAKWKGKTIELSMPLTSTVSDVKQALGEATGVNPAKQKLADLKRKAGGSRVDDGDRLEELALKVPRHRFMMIGNPDHEVEALHSLAAEYGGGDDVLNDLDYDYAHAEDGVHPHLQPENLAKQAKYSKRLKVNVIHEPRPGSRLLVLDLDYTMFDMKSKAANFVDLKRPFTDEMLTLAYRAGYDLCVWSQTSWRWLELKLTELGLLSHPDYRISFVLDKTCMFSVTSRMRDNSLRKHQVKSLQLIYDQFPGRWGPHNTIHIDDLGRNFAMNPYSGLKIKAYKKAHKNRSRDRELVYLARYLTLIAELPTFDGLDHGQWKEYVAAAGTAETAAASSSSSQPPAK